jgi:hypothetical protein
LVDQFCMGLRRGSGKTASTHRSLSASDHPWRFAARLSGLFTLLIVPFAIWATGAKLDTLIGLAYIYAIALLVAGLLLHLTKPLGRYRRFGERVKRQRRPWRAAAGTAYSLATGSALRMAEPDWSRVHVILFAALSGAVFFVVFGLIGRFVGDPPGEPDPAKRGPSRYEPI